ncbi:MAG: zonular occludens toxin domain-containing protein [Nevskia sp.]|jgi:hypothetical protein|nr:zonular occludens toxin domain-containing protein [Nevskia sp.]
MITLLTGNPGSGKTLWCLGELERLIKVRAENEKPCQVYYNGIPLLPDCPYFGDWKPLSDEEARDPHALPAGTVLVVDEAYRLWPSDASAKTSKVPGYVELFATHRHRGHDVFLIMQKRSQIHPFLRDLVNRHVHLEAPFGLNRATVYSWERLADPTKKGEFGEAVRAAFPYPVERYKWYKSADLHVKERRLPLGKVAVIGAASLFAIAAFYAGYRVVSSSGHGADSKLPSPAPSPGTAAADLHPAPRILNAADWTAQYKERLPGVPRSAPIYDAVFKAQSYPRVAGCASIRIGDRHDCRCNTQQGSTITTMTAEQCEQWIHYGAFDPGSTMDIYADPDRFRANRPLPSITSDSGQSAAGSSGLAAALDITPSASR